MEFGTAVAVTFVGLCLLGLLVSGLAFLFDRGVKCGQKDIQQEAVNRELGFWEVYRGENVFRWGKKEETK